MQNVEGLGVARIKNGEVVGVVEKPKQFVSNLAVTGIYLFDDRCFQLIDTLYPSSRNELEITDLINAYCGLGACDSSILSGDWMDAGTFESLQRAEIVFGSD